MVVNMDEWEDCTLRTDTHLVLSVVLQETLDTAARKLYEAPY
jgi:hypothetical protein